MELSRDASESNVLYNGKFGFDDVRMFMRYFCSLFFFFFFQAEDGIRDER